MRKLNVSVLFIGALLMHVSATAIAQTTQIYNKYCSSCHAADGSASTAAGKRLKAADLRSKAVQDLSDEEIYKTIAYGVRHKNYPHAFARRGLTEKQVADLVVYIRKLAQ
jgi:mono/diheme cytochrome c family protein